MRQISWVKSIRCNNSVQCSDNFVSEIENQFGIILKPKTMLGNHNGWLNIYHTQNKHTMTIFLYEKNDPTRHILKTQNIPTKKNLEDL